MTSNIRQPWETKRGGREVCYNTAAGWREYNRRTAMMATRQKGLCALCGFWMDEDDRTFDHEHGRGMGGSKRDDRIEVDGKKQNAAVHLGCNVAKGSRKVPYIL